MKKFMKSLMLVAAAAMALTSCQNEEMDSIQKNETYTLSFTADAPEDTRTAVTIDGSTAKFAWTDGEEVAFLQWAGSTANKVVSTSYNCSEDKATFGATFNTIDGAEAYNYIAIYPNINYASHDLAKDQIRIKVPESQVLTVGSFDPNADLMISLPVSDNTTDLTESKDLRLQFGRVASIAKMNLKGVKTGENIKNVTFILGENTEKDINDATKRLTGRYEFNFDSEIVAESYYGHNYVELNTPYGGEFLANEGGTEVFFTCLPGNYSGTYTVNVTTDKATYSKTGTIAEDKALNFKKGQVLAFNLTVANRQEVAAAEDYTGQYLVVAKNSANWWTMKYDTTANYRVAVDAGISEYTDYTSFPIDTDHIWNITKVEGETAYTISNYDNSKYLAATSGSNYATIVDADNAEKVTLTKAENGSFAIKTTSSELDETRILAFNESSTRYAFYKTSTTMQVEIYLVPVTGAIKQNLSMAFTPATVALTVGDTFTAPTLTFSDGNTYAVTYTVENTEGTVASVSGNVVSVNTSAAGAATVTATFAGNDTYNSAKASYTITVEEAGSGSGEVTISFADATHRVSQDGDSQVWANGGVTFTNNKSASTNAVVGNVNPVRLYANSSLLIEAPNNIVEVVFNCNNTTYASALKNSIGNEATVSGKVVTLTPAATSKTYTIAKLTAQVRLDSMVVTFGNESEITPTLATPENLTTEVDEDNIITISWNEVANAESYILTVNGTEIETTYTNYDIEGAYNTNYQISVVAVAEGYNNSTAATTSVEIGAEPGTGVQPTTETLNIYATTGVLASGNSSISWTSGDITVTNKKGSTAIRTSDSNHYRVYSGSELTIGTAAGNITKIVITCTTADYATVMKTSFTNAKYAATVSGSVVTVTGNATSEYTMTASAQTRLSKVEVTYEK